MVNEEDHLRIQVLSNGLDFKKVWEADSLDTGIEPISIMHLIPNWAFYRLSD